MKNPGVGFLSIEQILSFMNKSFSKVPAENFEAELPDNFHKTLIALAPSAGKFLVPPSPRKERALQLLRRWYNDGEGNRALAHRLILDEFPGKMPYTLAMLFLYDDVIGKIIDRDPCQDEWEAFCSKYQAAAYVLPDKEIKIRSSFKFMSFFLVKTFYEEAAKNGFSDCALSLLGRALQCNVNLDLKKIYNHASKSKEWQQQVKSKVKVTSCEAKTAEVVDPYSKFNPDFFRVFVDSDTFSEVPESDATVSYFWVLCYYKSVQEKGINQEALRYLGNALQLNPSLVRLSILTEGLRHRFIEKRNILSRNLKELDKVRGLFENYQTKPDGQRDEVFQQAYALIFKMENEVLNLQRNSVGGIGFFLAARISWELGEFAYFINQQRPSSDPLVYFKQALKSFYIAEYLSDNFPMYGAMMTVYSEFSSNDGVFRDNHARKKLYTRQTAMFFTPDAQARKEAIELLQSYKKPNERIILPAAINPAGPNDSMMHNCGFRANSSK